MSGAATPKSAGRRQAQAALASAQSAVAVPTGLLDVFPVWQDQVAEKETPIKYEDPLGTALPTASQPFCDAWKRSEELLHGAPNVPMVCLKPAVDPDKKGKGTTSRELDGRLYAGHETFDWMLGVISYIISAEKYMKRGEYLWELIHPKDKDGLPARSPSGKYRIKIFLLDTWRCVTIDDRIPVDLFGRALLVGSRPLQLWPLLLCKAVLKVMAVYKSLDMSLPHQVAAFQMLTGWPQEDLLDPLGGSPMAGGRLFDRLEDVLGGPLRQVQDLPAVASCCLIKRSKPQRAPPRLVVLTGPSGVGRSHLIAKLVAEFPDKFGVTVSHTSRPPKEHEVDGKDFYFTDKPKLLADVRAKKFLEAARVTVHTRPCNSSEAAAAEAPPRNCSYWYGTSLATVREVAATGKLCLMSLDMQGAEALRSNKRIDGLYLYVNTSTPSLLESRQKQRLSEDISTITKRVSWAKQQLAKSSTPGLFDAMIPNTSMNEVYAALKEAISTLSPIIRNRLRGLPAYVLDYSDLIPPNSVEKPFLKPVILTGPNTGERRKLLEMLVAEFPDVFAWPRQHTTRPVDEHASHIGVDGDELQLVTDKPGTTPRLGVVSRTCDAADLSKAAAEGPGDNSNISANSAADHQQTGAEEADSNSKSLALGPPPIVMSKEEFDAAAAAGKFLESHADLFKHKLITHKTGYSMEHVREVIKSGKLPLLDLEAEGAEAVKLAKSVDCLTIFLAPPSVEVHEQRLKEWATESDEEIAERQAVAAAEAEAVQMDGVFDDVVINDDLEQGYQHLKAAISKFRPDLIPPADDSAAAQAAKKAAASNQPVPLLVMGPAGGGREQLVQQLLQRYPQRFVTPKKLTDRKPAKGEKDTPEQEFVKPEVLAKLVTQGQVVYSQQDHSGSNVAITADALRDLATAGRMAVIEVGVASIEQVQSVLQHPAAKGAFVVHVLRKAVLSASLKAAGAADTTATVQLQKAAAQLQDITAAGLAQAVVTHDDPEEAFAQLQEPLCAASPWAMPPLLMPLVVAAPFGSGKRAVLQKLVKMLPEVLAVPKVVTSKPRAPGSSEDMEVVTFEVAQQMLQEGKFLVEQQVLGHVYGITAAAVRKLQASGKLPMLDLDRVADVAKLKASGFQAIYIYLQPPSLEQLQQRISADVLADPPLYHEPADAAAAAAAEAVQEVSAAAAHPELFDGVLLHDPQDMQTTLGKLSEVLQQHYPAVVHTSFVWGFGRPLWDPSVRRHGLKPLKVMVLGPAASGKTTQCAELAARFNIPHINAGDLLYAEVAAKTAVGLEAKKYMDSSQTVPDHYLLRLLLKRLATLDCQAQGWVLDGFPHTKKQAQQLADAGHVPDKVIMLDGPHAMLLDRVKYRRIDYSTGKVYHLAEPGSLSEAVRPLKADGSPDSDVLSRLVVRHDDSMENVTNRLALWDRQAQGLHAVYEDVVLRLPAAGNPDELYARVEAFVKLEASIGSGLTPGSIHPRIMSHQLEELMYRVIATVRYQQQQLVQLQQLDGKIIWCDLKELASNCSCMLLAHNPAGMPIVKSVKRLDSSSIPRQYLLAVDSPEPFRLLVCLSMGPQHLAVPPAPATKMVVVLAGPAGAGRSTLARQLLKDFKDKLSPVALLTNRSPHRLEFSCCTSKQHQSHSCPVADAQLSRSSCANGSARSTPRGCTSASAGAANVLQPATCSGSEFLQFVPEQQYKVLKRSGQLTGIHTHLGHSYGVIAAAVEQTMAEGKAAVMVGSLLLADHLRKNLPDTQIVCVFVDTKVAALDCHLRQSKFLEEERLQELLQDANEQKQFLQELLEEQEEAVRDELLQQAMSAAAAGTAASQQSSPSPAPAAAGAPGASRLAIGSAGPKPAQPQQAVATQQQALQQQQQFHMPAVWLHAVTNPAGQLQTCYTEVKAAVSKRWSTQQRCLPGLLMVQRCSSSISANLNSSTGQPTSKSSSSGSTVASEAGVVAVTAAANTAGLDVDVYSQSQTVLRLKSITAAGSLLQLPRGKQLLQLQCSPLLLHCISFCSAADFTLEEASKLLPSYGINVTSHEGQVEALQPGSRHLVFRYLLRPTEPCSASFELRTSSAALQSCSQLLLVCSATRQITSHVLNQPSEVQLECTEKGYILLCLAEPHVEVPAGGWSIKVTSSKPLHPLQDLTASKQTVLEGSYAVNAKAVVARYVISPTVSVQLALLSQLWLPLGNQGTTSAAPAANTTAAGVAAAPPSSNGKANSNVCSTASSILINSSKWPRLPLAYTLQLYDTGGAKETTWGASYKVLAEACGGPDGRAMVPSVQLQPGKYVLVLQLQPEACVQWVDPITGTTDPVPNWQLVLLPSVDEKACPIAKDDAYERHFKATAENWQQQAAQATATTAPASGRPASGAAGAAAARASAAIAKDRPKQAQAALERHLAAVAAEQQLQQNISSAPSGTQGLTLLSIPGNAPAAGTAGPTPREASAAAGPGAVPSHGGSHSGSGARKASQGGRHKTPRGGEGPGVPQLDGAGSLSHTGSVQLTPRYGSGSGGTAAQQAAPGGIVRQLKNGDTLLLSPMQQVKRIAPINGSEPQLTASAAEKQQCSSYMLQQATEVHAVAAVQPEPHQPQPAIGVIQAQQVVDFAEWRSNRQAEVQAAAVRKQTLLKALTGSSAVLQPTLTPPTPVQPVATHKQQDKLAGKVKP